MWSGCAWLWPTDTWPRATTSGRCATTAASRTNADAMARLGWLLLQIGQPQEALRSVDEALAIKPSLDDARWFRANI